MPTSSFKLTIVVVAATVTADAGELIGTVRVPAGSARATSPAVVYVATADIGRSEPARSVVVDQKNLQFVPRVQAVAAGGSIVFRNSDREAHNVNSQSGCCAFNHLIGPGGELPPIETARPGVVRLLCNIHHQMRGFVVVCPSSFYAVTDAAGDFRIEGVPDGPHKVIVWQEFSKQQTREVVVAGPTRVDFELELSAPVAAARPAAATAPNAGATPWAEVRRRIAETLDQAMVAAQRSGGATEAERLVLDAYFLHFEAAELETAVRLFRGEERVFDLERMFAQIRKPLLADLAAGRGDAASVHAAIQRLLTALDEDIAELSRRGIADRRGLMAQPTSPAPGRRASHVDVRGVVKELQDAFAAVERLVAAGQNSAAASALADTYFQIFHRIEPALASHNFPRVRRIEASFLDVRVKLEQGLPAADARAELSKLWTEIDLAASSMERTSESKLGAAAAAFWNSSIILMREGVEALLIVTALVMYLRRVGQGDAIRSIRMGLAAAVIATIVTWAALQWALAQSGMAQEVIEGASALAAAAVLFYVSYWLLSKSEARRWQEFLTRQVGQSVSTGSRWAIGAAAFLAVYREGAETILMFQPLLARPTAPGLIGLAAGAGFAAVVLVAFYRGLRVASFRMAIRPFFRFTGALLFVLAVVFAGKGVAELQEAGVLAVTPLPEWLRGAVSALPVGVRDALGVSPTAQACAIQFVLVAGAAASLVAVWLAGRFAPDTLPAIATPAAAPRHDATLDRPALRETAV
jgi:high-affinity iron transporter